MRLLCCCLIEFVFALFCERMDVLNKNTSLAVWKFYSVFTLLCALVFCYGIIVTKTYESHACLRRFRVLLYLYSYVRYLPSRLMCLYRHARCLHVEAVVGCFSVRLLRIIALTMLLNIANRTVPENKSTGSEKMAVSQLTILMPYQHAQTSGFVVALFAHHQRASRGVLESRYRLGRPRS